MFHLTKLLNFAISCNENNKKTATQHNTITNLQQQQKLEEKNDRMNERFPQLHL